MMSSEAEHVLTLDELLSNPDGAVTAAEVFDALELSDADLLRAAADALPEDSDSPPWRRRLLAWRLERLAQPEPGRPGRKPDFKLAREFFRMREKGVSYGEAVEAHSVHAHPFDRNVQRKVARAKKEAKRRLAAAAELFEEACRVAFSD